MRNSRFIPLWRMLIMLLACAAALYASQKTERVNVVHIVDGDTFVVLKSDGTEEKVRLIGIDCPESGLNPKLYRDREKTGRDVDEIMRAGRLATDFVRTILKPGDHLDLEYDVQPRDKYGRALAYAFLGDGRMVNMILLEKGHASLMTMPPNVKYVEELLAAFRLGRSR